MIQRIQSLLLFVAAVMAIVVCFINVGRVDLIALNGEGKEIGREIAYQFDAFTLQEVNAENEPVKNVMHVTYIALMWIASAILSLVTIFLYKNRILQVRLNRFNILLMLAALVVMLYVYPDIIFKRQAWFVDTETLRMEVNFSYWLMMLAIPVVCIYFASRAIRSDEKKVRAADRLR
jgi:short subunit fatty acids transporter